MFYSFGRISGRFVTFLGSNVTFRLQKTAFIAIIVEKGMFADETTDSVYIVL